MSTHDCFRRRAFSAAFAASCLLHLGLLLFLGWELEIRVPANQPYFEFVRYTPTGGAPGGADNDEAVIAPETTAAFAESMARAQNEQAQTAAPEPEQPESRIDVPEDNGIIAVEPEASRRQSESRREIRRHGGETAPEWLSSRAPSPTAPVTAEASIDRLGGGGAGAGKGGVGGTTHIGNRDRLGAYAGTIQRRINQFKHYPESARRHGVEGVVTVSFTVGEDGTVRRVRLYESSGNEALDAEGLALPIRAAPFAPIPPEIGRKRLRLTLPVHFSLD